MSSYVGKVGSCCNNYNVQNGMFNGPYLNQTINTSILEPRIKPYSGWASYKNNISGQFNRQLCYNCYDFKGYPQTPGLYPVNIQNSKLPRPNPNNLKLADDFYQIYQAERLSNDPGSYNSNYVNYLNNQSSYLYPKRYVKGHWPDEKLIFTNTPTNSCNTVLS